jgi:membrane dipeptidase
MKLPVAALLVIAASFSAQGTSHLLAQTSSKPHRHATKTMTDASYSPDFFIDTHADTTQRMLDDHYDLTDPLNGGYVNIEAAKKGKLGAEFFSIWVEPQFYQNQYAGRTLALIDAVHQAARKHPDKVMMAYSVVDIERAHREHKLAALMGIEGGHSIENSLDLLDYYYKLGVRYMTLTWSNSNDWADSSGDFTDANVHHTKEGLTEFGKDVVYEMNRLGMMVDISHVADQTFYRTLILTRAPVIASHSSARALTNSPRNMTDEMLRALANNGGVVQANFFSAFVSEDWRRAWMAQQPERHAAEKAAEDKAKAEGKPWVYSQEEAMDHEFAAKIPRPPLNALIDHIDHMVKIAGIDHVGIGSDFDGIPSAPEGIDSAADLPKITAELKKRGYSDADCRKIMSGNLLRVFAQVEKVSGQLQAEEKGRPKIGETQPFHK